MSWKTTLAINTAATLTAVILIIIALTWGW